MSRKSPVKAVHLSSLLAWLKFLGAGTDLGNTLTSP